MAWTNNINLSPKNSLFIVFVVLFGIFACSASTMEYKFDTTWDNQTVADGTTVSFKLSIDQAKPDELIIETQAPFFDDPKLPLAIAETTGFVDGLWNYEVSEIFFLGSNNRYLEIELGPHGHYLVYSLEGKRIVTDNHVLLKSYEAEIFEKDGQKFWKGTAILDRKSLPPNVDKFNAYAIHKSGNQRRYMSLFPVPFGEFKDPDFHRLEYFGSIQLPL